MISFDHVGKRFFKKSKPFQALGDAHFDVRPGEFVSIVGPSGCGKSTLLNITAGLMKPSSGSVRYKGEPVDAVNTNVGYVTQADTLLPWRTVRQNIAIPLEIRHHPRAERTELIDEMIEKVGLTDFGNHYPAELSGGMRKRVVLARTLIYQPETLLMDEPFGALDAQLKLVLQQELLRLWSGEGTTILFVTHDLAEAVTLSDRVVVVSSRPGTMRTIKTIDIQHPRDVFDVRFHDRFRELQQELWAILQDDMLRGGEM
ncbi:MAG: ATP-binding cassette domain-containing protein [Actinophytocola sp.]|nr:ATP-binding cassette domain-containing protein [Actinophytocola sp.]